MGGIVLHSSMFGSNFVFTIFCSLFPTDLNTAKSIGLNFVTAGKSLNI